MRWLQIKAPAACFRCWRQIRAGEWAGFLGFHWYCRECGKREQECGRAA